MKGKLDEFWENLEHRIRTVIVLNAKNELVLKGALGRYVLEKQRLVDI